MSLLHGPVVIKNDTRKQIQVCQATVVRTWQQTLVQLLGSSNQIILKCRRSGCANDFHQPVCQVRMSTRSLLRRDEASFQTTFPRHHDRNQQFYPHLYLFLFCVTETEQNVVQQLVNVKYGLICLTFFVLHPRWNHCELPASMVASNDTRTLHERETEKTAVSLRKKDRRAPCT